MQTRVALSRTHNTAKTQQSSLIQSTPSPLSKIKLKFNVPLDISLVISETGALSSDVHLPFSNGGPAT